jgi:lysozyme
VNKAGIDLLKSFEGFRGAAYPDPATGGQPYTIGYGFTGNVQPGDLMTLDEAEDRLKVEVSRFEEGVLGSCKRMPSPNQLAAMVCLSFNIGLGNFKGSTVLRRHNAGETFAAGGAFLLWNKAAGKVMAGLIRRREAERSLYLDA